MSRQAAPAPKPRSRLADAVLPFGSLALLALMVGLIGAVAGKTFGYDFEAYAGAAHRLLEGQRLYDPDVSAAGGFAIYLYPPPFAVAMVPFLALPDELARVVWFVGMAACLPIAALLMPVRRDVRWLIVILGALDWPFLYSVKLGQVGPLLVLLFAAGWRWMDRREGLGAAIAIGTLVKVQPALIGVWAIVTRRRAAAVWAVAAVAVVCAAATLVTGIGAWFDYVALLGRVSSAVTTAHNCSPGAAAYQAGLSEAAANVVQSVATLVVVAGVLASWRFASAEASFMVTLAATQLLTPLVWDHYEVVLLVPAAWLLERGRTWAVALPLLGWIAVFDGVAWPAAASVPLVIFAGMAAVLWEGLRAPRGSARSSPQSAARVEDAAERPVPEPEQASL